VLQEFKKNIANLLMVTKAKKTHAEAIKFINTVEIEVLNK